MPVKKFSPVWHYFTANATYMQCNLCAKILSGNNGANAERHLKTEHKIELHDQKDYMRKRTANRQSGTDPPAKKLELVTFPINLNQLLAQQESTSQDDSSFLLKISNPIYPISLFQDQSLLNIKRPQNLSKHQILNKLSDHANLFLDQLRLQLVDRKFSVFTQIVEDCANCNYLSVSIQWLDNFTSKTTFLGLSKLESNTNIEFEIEKLLSRVGLQLKDTVLLTTSNSSVVKFQQSFNDLEEESIEFEDHFEELNFVNKMTAIDQTLLMMLKDVFSQLDEKYRVFLAKINVQDLIKEEFPIEELQIETPDWLDVILFTKTLTTNDSSSNDQLSSFKKLIDLFLNTIQRLQSANPAQVYGELQQLLFYTQQIANKNEFASNLAKKLETCLQNSFGTLLKPNSMIAISTLLDPSHFNSLLIHTTEAIGTLVSITKESNVFDNASNFTTYEEYLNANRQKLESSTALDVLMAEVKAYVKVAKKRGYMEDSKKFWTLNNIQAYPKVSQMAEQYLSCKFTSSDIPQVYKLAEMHNRSYQRQSDLDLLNSRLIIYCNQN